MSQFLENNTEILRGKGTLYFLLNSPMVQKEKTIRIHR